MEKNGSIKCSVEECKYNNHEEYCTLSQIKVGAHETAPKQVESTDCESFELGNF
jgi:hypothetical protein